jgi:DNA-binding response OmpR family regulator
MSALLLLESEITLAHTLKLTLQAHQWQVTRVQDGLSAFALGLTEVFRAAILDLDVIDLDAVQMIQQLRLRRPALKVIATSRLTTPEERSSTLEMRGMAYLQKTSVHADFCQQLLWHLGRIAPVRDALPHATPCVMAR